MGTTPRGAIELWETIEKKSNAAFAASAVFGNRRETGSRVLYLLDIAGGIDKTPTATEVVDCYHRLSAISAFLQDLAESIEDLASEIKELPCAKED